jgi:hypothetical protein
VKRTAIRKVSKKHEGRLREYHQLVQERLMLQVEERGHYYCEFSNFPGDVEPHHPKGRTGNNLFHFVLINPELHRQIHENPNWSRKMGYLS